MVKASKETKSNGLSKDEFMKRIGNLWEKIITFENLMVAAKNAQAGKRFRENVLQFNYNLETEIFQILHELRSKSYRPGDYKTFQIITPKPRFISAAPYRDRVVHHALCNVIIPVFEQSFISDSYANRVGYGTHRALRRFTGFCRTSTHVLQCDISKFFPSIDLEILKQVIRTKIKCRDTLWLIDLIIDCSNPQETVLNYFLGDDLLTPIQRRKGLPLGNLTSQFFANIYLNCLDHFIKEHLRCKKYVRYVDDFALFSDDKEYLLTARKQIELYLNKLRLIVHPKKTQLLETRHGVSFVGFRVFSNHIRVSSKNLRLGKIRLKVLRKGIANGRWQSEKLLKSVQAWRGHLQHGDTWQLQKQLFGDLLTEDIREGAGQ